MSILALLAVAAPASASAPYPVGEVLDAMRGACAAAVTAADGGERLKRAGWARTTAEPGSWAEDVLRQEREILGSVAAAPELFLKVVAGRQLFAFVGPVHLKSVFVIACSAQDPTAHIDDAAERIVGWAGRPSTNTSFGLDAKLAAGLDRIALLKNWRPGLDGVSNDTTIRYVPVEFAVSRVNGGLSYASEREIDTQ